MSDPPPSSSATPNISPAPAKPDTISPPAPPKLPQYLPPYLTTSFVRPPSHPNSSNPLFPSLGPHSEALRSLGEKIDIDIPYTAASSSSSSGGENRKVKMPEKCLTFCSQREDASPLCRMLCLRRRASAPTRAEALAKLRPPTRSAATQPASSSTIAVPASTSPASSSSTPAFLGFHPFESLRKRVAPYSIIYVRGTPEGVLGRYMEEMEYDDGMYDFGDFSRGQARSGRRRREDEKIEWLDWGDQGVLLHLPLTSLFYPLLSIPNTLTRLTTPSLNFLAQYRGSWSDGSQSRAWTRFSTEVFKGGAWDMLWKVRGFWEKRVQERKEELEKIREARRNPATGPGGTGRKEGVEGGKAE